MHSHWLRNILVILIIVQITMMILFFQNYHFVDQVLYNEVKDTKSLDALNVAVQLGRFDLASFFLAGIGVFISLAAIFAFIEVRSRAERTAKQTAELIAADVAQRVAELQIRPEASRIVEEYFDRKNIDINKLPTKVPQSGSDTDDIANAMDEDKK